MISIKEKINEVNKKLQEKFKADEPIELGNMYSLIGLFAHGRKIEIGDVAVIKISLKRRTAKKYYPYHKPKMTVFKLTYEILDENANDSMSIEELENIYNEKIKQREQEREKQKNKAIEDSFNYFAELMDTVKDKNSFIESLQHFKNLDFGEQFEILKRLRKQAEEA